VKKKVKKIFSGRGGVAWYPRTSRKSSIPNETRNQRGYAVVRVSGDHNVVTTSKKGANQRSSRKNQNYTKKKRRIPSSWETIDSQHPESQSSSRKKSSQPKRKGARIGISSVLVPKPSLVSRNYDPSSPMYYMPKFMRPYIEGIVDVIGDGHYGFRAIAEFVGLIEESHVMVRRALIKELKEHRNKYIEIYASERRYNYILDGLHPPKNVSSFAPPDKWLTLPDMGNIVATCYNRLVLEMTTLDIGVSETFFPLKVGLRLTRKPT